MEEQACGDEEEVKCAPCIAFYRKECLEVRDINVGVMNIQGETKNIQGDSFLRRKVRGGQWSHLLFQSHLTRPLKSLSILPGFVWFFSYPIPSPIVLTSSKTLAAFLVSYTLNRPGLQGGNELNATPSSPEVISFYRIHPIIMSSIWTMSITLISCSGS